MSKRRADESQAEASRTYFVDSADEHPDFFGGELPDLNELVDRALYEEEGHEETQAITVRPSTCEVALLDQIAKLCKQSRSSAARTLLAAAMRQFLEHMPQKHRETLERDAATAAGWRVVVRNDNARSE